MLISVNEFYRRVNNVDKQDLKQWVVIDVPPIYNRNSMFFKSSDLWRVLEKEVKPPLSDLRRRRVGGRELCYIMNIATLTQFTIEYRQLIIEVRAGNIELINARIHFEDGSIELYPDRTFKHLNEDVKIDTNTEILLNKQATDDILQDRCSELTGSSVTFKTINSDNFKNLAMKLKVLGLRYDVVKLMDGNDILIEYRDETKEVRVLSNKRFVVDNSTQLFSDLDVKSLDIRELDFSRTKTMNYMFMNSRFIELIWDGIDTSNVTSMKGLFFDTKVYTEVNMSTLNTSKVKTMYDMFRGSELGVGDQIDLSCLDTSELTDMSRIFEDCTYYDIILLKNWNTSQTVNFEKAFSGVNSGFIDLSSFDTSNALDLYKMLNVWNDTKVDFRRGTVNNYTYTRDILGDKIEIILNSEFWNNISVLDDSQMKIHMIQN